MAGEIDTVMNTLGGGQNAAVTLLGNPIILGIVSAIVIAAIYLYTQYLNQKHNPYFINNWVPSNNVRKVVVMYYRTTANGEFIPNYSEVCPRGAKGIYLYRFDMALDIPDAYFVYGAASTYLDYAVTGSKTGYPIKRQTVTKEKIQQWEKTGMTPIEPMIAMHKIGDKQAELLVDLHIDNVYNTMKERAEQAYSMTEKILAMAPSFIMLALILISMVVLFQYANQTSNAMLQAGGQLGAAYATLGEERAYCAYIVDKYGTNEEKKAYDSKPKPNF